MIVVSNQILLAFSLYDLRCIILTIRKQIIAFKKGTLLPLLPQLKGMRGVCSRGGAMGWLGGYSAPSDHASLPSEGEMRCFRRFLVFIVPWKPYFSPLVGRVTPVGKFLAPPLVCSLLPPSPACLTKHKRVHDNGRKNEDRCIIVCGRQQESKYDKQINYIKELDKVGKHVRLIWYSVGRTTIGWAHFHCILWKAGVS